MIVMAAPATMLRVSADRELAKTTWRVPPAETVTVPQKLALQKPVVAACTGPVHIASDRVVEVTFADVESSAVVEPFSMKLVMLMADSVRPPPALNPNVVALPAPV